MAYEEKDNYGPSRYGQNGSGYQNGYNQKDNYGNHDPYPNKYGKGGGKKPNGGSSILPWIGVAVVLGIYLNYLS